MHLATSALVLAIATIFLALVPSDLGRERLLADPGVPELRQRAQDTASLAWLDPGGALRARIGRPLDRMTLLRLRSGRAWAGDHVGEARINALFAGEASVARAACSTAGSCASTRRPDCSRTRLSRMDSSGPMATLARICSRTWPSRHTCWRRTTIHCSRACWRPSASSGRRSRTTYGFQGGQPVGLKADDRIFGNAEYAKDGLLPMVDRLGPDPWLGRLVEIADEILAASATPTRAHG